MRKLFYINFIVILLTSLLNASILKDKVENIINPNDYRVHNSLINLLFQDETKYIVNDKIKYFKLFKTLQEKGLLNLHLDKPSNIEVEFKSTDNSFKSYKMLNDTMHSLGYRYFFTDSMSVTETKNLTWNIILKTEYMLDPVVLIKELRQNGCKILEVTNNGSNKWSYVIDFENAQLSSAIKIEKNEKVKFQKPLKEYMLKVEDAKSLQVISKNLNYWFPDIVFFDKNLEVLSSIKKDYVHKSLKVEVPNETKYIKITDKYNLINIKRGLSVIVR